MQTHLPIGYKMVDGKIQIEQEKISCCKENLQRICEWKIHTCHLKRAERKQCTQCQ